MAPTESTQPNTAPAAETQPRPRTEIERVALALRQRGFDTSHQTVGEEAEGTSGIRHPSVEVEVEQDEREDLEEALAGIETAATYRVMWPDETPALRGWASVANSSDQSSRTAIVTSAPASRVDASEATEQRASFL